MPRATDAGAWTRRSLDDFQKTVLEPRQLGTGFYYDLILAKRMLSFVSGRLGKKDNGHKMEMGLANANDAFGIWLIYLNILPI